MFFHFYNIVAALIKFEQYNKAIGIEQHKTTTVGTVSIIKAIEYHFYYSFNKKILLLLMGVDKLLQGPIKCL